MMSLRDDAIWMGGLFATIVVVAGLVNRYRPAQRVQVRRIVILFLLYVVALGGAHGLDALGVASWASRFLFAAELLRAFTMVNIGATMVFSVLLPATGIMLPLLASDLLIGLGYVASTLGVLSNHDMKPTNVLAASAVVSAVLALSLQSTLGNILGGVALQLDGSIHEGDWIQMPDGKQGKVMSIRWRHTVLETRDWSTIIVPNSVLLANSIMLLGKRDGKPAPQRMWVYFNVDYRYPPSKVIDAVNSGLTASPINNVVKEPEPSCVCIDFGRERGTQAESFATYGVRYWVKDMGATDGTSSLVRSRIYTAMKRAEIPFAIPAETQWVQVEDEARAKKKKAERHGSRASALRDVSLFRSLKDEEIHTLADGLSHVIYAAGETCTRQGAVAHWLYILTSGSVEIRTTFDPDGPGPKPEQSVAVTKLEAPNFFGEMGLMTGEPRTANVVALTDVDCYRLDKQTLEHVLQERPEMANELSAILAKRRTELIAIREDLTEAQKKDREERERDRILKGILSFFNV